MYDVQCCVGSKDGKFSHEYGVDQYVVAALNVYAILVFVESSYLDILNLFLYILQLFTSCDRN